jgi:hypothetical protein
MGAIDSTATMNKASQIAIDREVDVGHASSQLEWFGRRGTSIGVQFKNGKRYEFADVSDSLWRGLFGTVQRAERWKESGNWAPKKPAEVSVGTFYHQVLEPHCPCWRVEVEAARALR